MRASYRHAVAWIARNDSAADNDALDAEAVGRLVTSCLIADIFGVGTDKVGRDVVKERARLSAMEIDEEG